MNNPQTSTEPYKGVRDFYPEDQFLQEYLFETMSGVCERFGYESYNASILEPANLYRSKTSEEIVNEQTYTFIDRGEREVTLRPEMTPSVARMVAGKRRELTFPLRWFSIGNFFRYERPQRGRLREFWQLNADIFGVEGIAPEAEIISLAHAIMLEMGATEHDFEIRINDRALLQSIFEKAEVTETEQSALMRLLDKKESVDGFDAKLAELLGTERALTVRDGLTRASSSAHLEKLRSLLYSLGISNVVVDTSIVRGFTYYTGMVFEVYDTAPENRRALFGGGRYDNLLSIFGNEKVPAVGFGMGDVTAKDFLESRNLLPVYRPATELLICPMDESSIEPAMRLAQELRAKDVTVGVNLSNKKIGDQIKQADKMQVPFVLVIGEKERNTGMYTLKQLSTGNEYTLSAEHIPDHLFSSLG